MALNDRSTEDRAGVESLDLDDARDTGLGLRGDAAGDALGEDLNLIEANAGVGGGTRVHVRTPLLVRVEGTTVKRPVGD